MPEIRTFIALTMPSSVQEKIAVLQEQLKPMRERISWPRPSNIHLTVKFLGNVDSSGLSLIEDALAQSLASSSVFTFTVKGLGAFPNIERPRVLWVGVNAPDNAFNALAKSVDDALIQFGFSKESRKFTPHLSLGRVKSQPTLDFIDHFHSINFDAGVSRASEIVLMRSELKPDGAVYTPLRKFQLKL